MYSTASERGINLATIRVQLTTYLSSDEQVTDWETVKKHFEGVPDAAVLRELIRGKSIDIGRGATKRQAIDEIRQEVKDLRGDVDSIKEILGLICEKVGVNAQDGLHLRSA